MKKLSLIPLDVWIASAIAIGVGLIALDGLMSIFLAAFGTVCAYIVVKTFTES